MMKSSYLLLMVLSLSSSIIITIVDSDTIITTTTTSTGTGIKNKFHNDDNNDDDEQHPSRQILHNLLHGRDENFGKLIKWNIPMSVLKESTQIDCGATKDLLEENTIAISICDNHIFQFHRDFKVTIYPQSRQKYSLHPDRLHLIDGYQVDLERIASEMVKNGGFRERSKFIMNYLPTNGSRLWMSLTRPAHGFEWRARIMVADYQSWMCSQHANHIETGPEFRFEYEMNDQRIRTIPISAGTRFFQIAHRIDQNDFLIYADDMYMDNVFFGKLCLGYKKENSLRLSGKNDCEYGDENDGKKNALVHLLETVQYGFTTFTQLALISPTKEMAILINRRVLTNFEHDYTYHTHKLIDFFVCDKNPNIKRLDEPMKDDDDKRRKKRMVMRRY